MNASKALLEKISIMETKEHSRTGGGESCGEVYSILQTFECNRTLRTELMGWTRRALCNPEAHGKTGEVAEIVNVQSKVTLIRMEIISLQTE